MMNVRSVTAARTYSLALNAFLKTLGGREALRKRILQDFFRNGFNGSGDDGTLIFANFFLIRCRRIMYRRKADQHVALVLEDREKEFLPGFHAGRISRL